MATKRTYQPKKLHGQKVHGFRKRMATVCPTEKTETRGRHLNNAFRDGGNR